MTEVVLNPGGSGPFNMSLLGEALERRMVAAFADFRLRASNPDLSGPDPAPETLESVSVYLGSVKSRERSDDGGEVGPKFPLVLVRPRERDDDRDENGLPRTTVAVDFVVGVRRIGNDGSRDVTAVIDRICTNLLRDPLIEGRARMELPLHSELGDDDAFPQWMGFVSATFNIPQPVEETVP